MATLRDVARRAGVSVGSVSAVANGAAVSPALRAKVVQAIEELGYVPDAVARSLKIGKTKTVGFVIPDITNPHFSGIARAVERACDAAGYTVMLSDTADDPAKELRHLQLMRTQRVDGVIMVPGGADKADAALLKKVVSAPVVLVDRQLADFGSDHVVLDNRMASRLLVEYLIRIGHRRIGIVSGLPNLSLSQDRLAGYREALEEQGVAYDERLVAWGKFQVEPAARATVMLLGVRPRPTAIIATSNHTTVGVMTALADQGFRCPQDISVAAIDDFAWARAFAPRLTTAAQPIEAIGREAVRCLLSRVSGEETGPQRTIVLQPSLIVRNSCQALG